MRYIEAPTEYTGNDQALFLAGGLSGCYDWQKDLASLLSNTDLAILNPRRTNFPMHNPHAAAEQIAWEYRHLRKVSIISFWFPPETLCPIALYELGAWSMTTKPLFIGIHPDYQRKQDIEIQTKLVRPDVEIVYSLAALADKILANNP